MKDQAIALNRISSSGQADGHSLEAQQNSTTQTASKLGVELIKSWTVIQSSRRGKNFGRKDMEEMLKFCRKNRAVKYLLIDFVNRLMREVEIMVYYKVLFNQLGVQLYFCDPAQHHLNTKDQYAQLMLFIEGFKAEQDNQARYETTIARMKERYRNGYYISHPHQGYMKSNIPGLHVPDPERFHLLKKGCGLIIDKQHTISQAVRWINGQGYRTRNGKKLDTDHFVNFIVDRYYCGMIDIRSVNWPKDVSGLHQPMLSVREHKLLVAAVTKRNPQIRRKYNPDFPLSGIIRHSECADGGGYEKFSGVNHNRGRRPSGSQRPIQPVYDCRDCRKRIPRKKTHDNFSDYLDGLQLLPDSETFQKALLKVWRNQRGSTQHRINALNVRKGQLEQQLKETAMNYSKEPEGAAKNALRLLIEDYDEQVKKVELELVSAKVVDSESEGFVQFAMQFTEKLKENWWVLSPENKQRGEQILFNGRIYADNTATVHTPNLSSIYRVGTNKKDLSEVNFRKVVELVGTAPTSAGVLVSRLQA